MSGNPGSGPPILHLGHELQQLFQARPTFEHKPPVLKRKMPPLSGVAKFVDAFELYDPPERVVQETPRERQERVGKAKIAAHAEQLEADIAKYDPKTGLDPEVATEEPYSTLFVSRISYDTTEKKLKREFEQFGDIKKIRLVEDSKGWPNPNPPLE
jgi:U1 small nuclear ribonucleoprotein